MRGRTLVFVALVGCAFEPRGDGETPIDAPEIDAPIDADPGDIDGPDIDAPVDAALDAPDLDAAIDAPDLDATIDATVDAPIDAPPIIDIAYLPPSAENVGTGNVIIGNPLTIDTTPGATLPNFGTGTSFSVAPQTSGGPDIVVVHVGSFTVSSTLRVIGTRPFAIVAGGAVNITGIINASAVGNTVPGPGGSMADLGAGHGNPGVRRNGTMVPLTAADSGGGGASYGSSGGQGGNARCTINCNPDGDVIGGTGGSLYNGGLSSLMGGSGGGSAPDASATCAGQDGGAGGGALLIYSAVSVTVSATGVIEVNGGGGGRGLDCVVGSGAGSGGGSGGQLDLQSPSITVMGEIAANGGGGGGGADSSNGDGVAGTDGLNSSNQAGGGAGTGPNGGDGGPGAAGSSPAGDGEDMGDDQNGGGGGGGVGRVTVRHQGAAPTVPSSPSATYIMY